MHPYEVETIPLDRPERQNALSKKAREDKFKAEDAVRELDGCVRGQGRQAKSGRITLHEMATVRRER